MHTHSRIMLVIVYLFKYSQDFINSFNSHKGSLWVPFKPITFLKGSYNRSMLNLGFAWRHCKLRKRCVSPDQTAGQIQMVGGIKLLPTSRHMTLCKPHVCCQRSTVEEISTNRYWCRWSCRIPLPQPQAHNWYFSIISEGQGVAWHEPICRAQELGRKADTWPELNSRKLANTLQRKWLHTFWQSVSAGSMGLVNQEGPQERATKGWKFYVGQSCVCNFN